MNVKRLTTPITNEAINELRVGDTIEISGTVYVGRDAVLPQIVNLIKTNGLSEYNIELEGGIIFHSAVSIAGLGPTSSNKVEIEGNFPELSAAGVKVHLGKGALSPQTVEVLKEHNSIFVVIPPISAYLTNKTLKREVAAFENEGMEAFWKLEVDRFPGIVAVAHGETIF
ncbi:fumarate hydratase subunit beta [Proteiniborus ethanoligenes]|uniref:Fumarate hydratase subunit beta n=1 Tax=Proteiniborus ethanoligenes TaxID=415015 RepID=A0A1H3KQF2_9FIRM|nr:fumarate hydratase C-terminal domain-containing protein [Proteiniborus ethanoligenes]SDY54392.1 fumarate hydratase subunit beta [Proteiniborus ethanoligenes]